MQATGLGDDFEDNHDARRKDYDNNGECCLNDNNSEEEKNLPDRINNDLQEQPWQGPNREWNLHKQWGTFY